jgi:ATP-dependent Clp protease ATP-binding subunit ClpA
MDFFDDDLNKVLTNAIEYMIGNNQNELTIYHLCYSFFNNLPSYSAIDVIIKKDIIITNLEKIISKFKRKDGDPDLDDKLKSIISYSHIYCNSLNKEKINQFDLMKGVLKEESFFSFFKEIDFNEEKLDSISELFNSAKTSVKTSVKRRRGLNKNSFIESNVNKNVKILMKEDKNDLGNFLINLNDKYKSDKYLFEDYDNKIPELIKALLRKEKSNPLLLGKPGVGKTAIIEGLVKKIISKDVPDKLKNKTLFEINLSALLAGTNFRGDFEKRFQNIIEFVKENENIILFIDEIHCLKGLGSASKGDMDLANMLKPYLSSGEISCIGATTYEEYKNSIGSDKALNRRFEIININEPTKEVTKHLLKSKKSLYEDYHKVKISEELIDLMIELTDRFISKGNFPDKAFDILDLSCSSAELLSMKVVEEYLIIENISKVSGISKDQIIGYDKVILNLENNLKEKIFGQDDPIKSICQKITVSKVGLSDPNKPLASFLLIGSTGVGKTEIVNQLSKELSMNLIRFDMSEFSEKGSASRLIGTSAGYVGYENGGQLTELVYHNPYSIILFDEIEKADKGVFNLFLQVLDYGKLTDGSGKVVDFKNTIIFMTSNAGAESLMTKSIGLTSNINNNFEKTINSTFSPEFRNRISKIILFNSLDISSMERLIDKNLTILINKLKMKNIVISFSDKVKDVLIKNGFNSKLGARPLERYIEDNISYLIAKNIIEKKLSNEIHIDHNENEFVIK